MPKSRVAGNRKRRRHHKTHRRHRKGRGTRRSRRGLAGNIMRVGAISVDDLARGSGNLVGRFPVVGTYGRRGFNMVGRTGSDLFDLAGTTTDRAAGVLTSPFKRLFRRGPKKRMMHKRSKHKRHKRHKKRTHRRRR